VKHSPLQGLPLQGKYFARRIMADGGALWVAALNEKEDGVPDRSVVLISIGHSSFELLAGDARNLARMIQSVTTSRQDMPDEPDDGD
jgi:hypothetical protein